MPKPLAFLAEQPLARHAAVLEGDFGVSAAAAGRHFDNTSDPKTR
jgi:hypothetical protein